MILLTRSSFPWGQLTHPRPLLLLLGLSACLSCGPGCSEDSSTPGADSGSADLLCDGRPTDASQDQSGVLDLTETPPDLATSDASVVDLRLGEAVQRPDIFVQASPSLNDVTLLVNLGDSIAAGYGVPNAASYRALLLNNNDQIYPEFVGKDLSNLYPGIGYADLSWPGATSDDLPTQLANTPANPAGETLVLISAGGNDLLFNFAAALDPQQARAMAKEAVAQLQNVVAHFSNSTLYPDGATVAIMNVYDPTDGTGSFPPNAPVVGSCADAAPYLDLVGDVLMQSLEAFNQEIAAYVLGSDVLLADIHSQFLGHGFQHANPAAPFYVPADPTLWFAPDCIHPNSAGHHAIRQLLWQILFPDL